MAKTNTASLPPVMTFNEKRMLAGKLLRQMEAGDKLPPDEELWLMAWAMNATPAIKARLAKLQEAQQPAKQPEPPKKIYSEVDIKAVGCKMDEIGFMLVALHEAASSHDLDSEVLEVMAIEFAKRGMRIIDACHEKLGQSPMGNWAEEFEEAAEEVD